ncbi:hypothetical protein ABIC02_001035 [Bradyrhizobium sp. RT5a]
MAAIEDCTADLVDDFDHGQIAGENGGKGCVFACDSIEQWAEVLPGGAVRIPRGTGEIDDDVCRAGASLHPVGTDLQPIGAAVLALVQHQTFELEQRVETCGARLRRCRPYDLDRDIPAVDRQRLAAHPSPRMLNFTAKLDGHVEPIRFNASRSNDLAENSNVFFHHGIH